MMQGFDSALQIAISDKEIQAYLQRPPFGVGADNAFFFTPTISSERLLLPF
jgi:hypothetical protein